MLLRDGEEAVNRTVACLPETHNFASRIDAMCEQQKQWRIRRNKGIEIGHYTVVPEERARIEASVKRRADNIAIVADAETCAGDIPLQRVQIPDAGIPGPTECVKSGVTGKIRGPDNLVLIVDFARYVSGTKCSRSTQITQIDELPFFPQQGVAREDVDACLGVERRADARGADDMAAIVYAEGPPVWITAHRGKFENLSVSPHNGLLLELLGASGWAGQIQRSVLGISSHFAAVINQPSLSVFTSESRQGIQHALKPDKWQAGAEGAKAAEILSPRVLGYRFGQAGSHADCIDSKGFAVRPAKSRRGQIDY